jgi:hypothetical protein
MDKGMSLITNPQDINKYSDCLVAKMQKAARGCDPAFTAVAIGQGLALDVGFMFQKSKNTKRTALLAGINGQNAYCSIYNFHSELVFGVMMAGNTLPITWLHLLLTCIAPLNTSGGIVCMDLGGETGKNKEVHHLFTIQGCLLQPTGALSSSQHVSGERPHSTIGNAVHAMLHSAALPRKFWEYMIYHFLRIHALLPHGQSRVSPYTKVTGKPADFSHLRAFGCRIYCLSSTTTRTGKSMTDNVNSGRFLGYGASMKTFIYVHARTGKVNRATHAMFDEAELSSNATDLTPNSLALWNAI